MCFGILSVSNPKHIMQLLIKHCNTIIRQVQYDSIQFSAFIWCPDTMMYYALFYNMQLAFVAQVQSHVCWRMLTYACSQRCRSSSKSLAALSSGHTFPGKKKRQSNLNTICIYITHILGENELNRFDYAANIPMHSKFTNNAAYTGME